MFTSKGKQLTELQHVFLEPTDSTHRQYEALRAYFAEGLPSHEVAKRFGYTPGSFRMLCHQFRQNPQRPFFIQPRKGPHRAPKRDPVRDQVIAMRKQNLSIYDISETLKAEGQSLSPVTVSLILKCTFRTLCRPSEVILEEPTVEGGSGALDRRFHAL